MGLSKESTGINAIDAGLVIKKASVEDKIVALAGNPNVGKSTVFNGLTGLRQHTGNWPGKTVTNAQGYCEYLGSGYVLVDLPGCYSLMSHSAEEEAARDFICFGGADATIVVCDATCLERNMNLVLQTLEITSNVVVCINLMDEAKKKKIKIDIAALSERLGVPVVGTEARSKKGLDALMEAVRQVPARRNELSPFQIGYPDYIERAVSRLERSVASVYGNGVNARWLALMLLHCDESERGFIEDNLDTGGVLIDKVLSELCEAREEIEKNGITEREVKDDIVSSLVRAAEDICAGVVRFEDEGYKNKDMRIDKVISGKWTGFPIMILALLGIFWITITGANYPSQALNDALFWVEDQLIVFFRGLNAPQFLYEMLVLGVYRVLAWVISVMLPPMAIFFPLFTILEDAGFLPRVAFNLDKCFKKCHACGKQALTMWVVNLC